MSISQGKLYYYSPLGPLNLHLQPAHPSGVFMDQQLQQEHAKRKSNSTQKGKYDWTDVHQCQWYEITLLRTLWLFHVHLCPQPILHAILLNSKRPEIKTTTNVYPTSLIQVAH